MQQNSLTKTVHKDRSEKLKSTTKLTSNSSHGSSKEENAAPKRRISRENGSHSSEEKKIEKKRSLSTSSNVKSSSNVKTQNETKKISKSKVDSISKIDSKSDAKRNVEPIKKVSSVDKSHKDMVKSEKKKSIDQSAKSKTEQKRSKDKLSLSSEKEFSQSKSSKTVKSSESLSQSKTVSREKRQVPLKASHAIGAKSIEAANISSKNVMNQVHNVTVQSPPPVRREIAQIEEQIEEQRVEQQSAQPPLPRGRTRTRTLGEDEIVLLKPKPTDISLNQQALVTNTNGSASAPVEIKPPISFEVMLNDKIEIKLSDKGSKVMSDKDPESSNCVDLNNSDNESADYEDDFESYESDFETDITDEEDEVDENEEFQDDTSISSRESDVDDNVISTSSKHPFETGHSIDNSEFDSGSFEMKVLSARARERNEIKPTATVRRDQQIEMQNDSGIENYSNTFGANAVVPTHNGQMSSLDLNNKTFDNISDIENEGANSLDTNNSNPNKMNHSKTPKPKSQLARRGAELLSKITLDVMNYVLFDFKPIPYELFMKIYGNSNTTQIAVQTHNDRIDQECQSDAIAMQTNWTQYPITFYTEHIGRVDFGDYQNGCGTAIDEKQSNGTNDDLSNSCESSLNRILSMSFNTNSTERPKDEVEHFSKHNIDYEQLNRFLLESEVTLSRILNVHAQQQSRSLNEPTLPFTNGFITLKPSFSANFAPDKVHRTIAIDALPGFLFTIHRENAGELNIIAMWNLSKLNRPVCLLSVWSKVLCIEIHPKIKDIVFAGLDDGYDLNLVIYVYLLYSIWPNHYATQHKNVKSHYFFAANEVFFLLIK